MHVQHGCGQLPAPRGTARRRHPEAPGAAAGERTGARRLCGLGQAMRVDAVVWPASSERVGGLPKPCARDAKASPVLARHGRGARRQHRWWPPGASPRHEGRSHLLYPQATTVGLLKPCASDSNALFVLARHGSGSRGQFGLALERVRLRWVRCVRRSAWPSHGGMNACICLPASWHVRASKPCANGCQCLAAAASTGKMAWHSNALACGW